MACTYSFVDQNSKNQTLDANEFKAWLANGGLEFARAFKAADNKAAGSVSQFVDFLYAKISSGEMPKDNPALKKMVEQVDGTPASPQRMKQAQEQLESAIVRIARDIVQKNNGIDKTFNDLLALYSSQPNLNVRDSTSIENQAYSTPAPLAYLASLLARIDKKTSVYEPTAGNGMLTIGASPKNVTANEFQEERANALRALNLRRVIEGDALKANVAPKSQDSVITNPPFGQIKDENNNSIKVDFDGFTIGQIDHLIAAKALETMKDDGSATLIIGANKVAGGISNNDRIFFNWLYSNYNVTGHFEVDGKLYTRQGASWPVRVITINGRQKSSNVSPVEGVIERAKTWEQVYDYAKDLLDTVGRSNDGTSRSAGRGSESKTERASLPNDAIEKTPRSNQPESSTGKGSNGDVTRGTARNLPDSEKRNERDVGSVDNEQRHNDGNAQQDQLGGKGKNKANGGEKPTRDTGADGLAKSTGELQTPYVTRSANKDDGILIPSNMAQPTQDALSKLEDDVGDIDEFVKTELGYKSKKELQNALMGLQIDSVALAINQIKNGGGFIIADQTGIGKGRQAASIIRWAERNGYTPVFMSAKPSLFTDMFNDLEDIGSTNIKPFIMNADGSIKGKNGEKLFANNPSLHKTRVSFIRDKGRLPGDSNAIFLTYSQINKPNAQREALLSIAPNAVFILDESHSAAGKSATGEFIISALGLAKGVTYLSATYAKRPDNMPLYFKTEIGKAIEDSTQLSDAMDAGGLSLQTVVSNNLVKAGNLIRRERSYDGVSIDSKSDSKNKDLHESLSDITTLALRAIVNSDDTFHSKFVKTLQKELEREGKGLKDNAGNNASKTVQHTEFSSVVHNFIKQMLLGLKAQTAADEAIASIKRGEKPIIAVENTMGSFLNEYASANGLSNGDPLGKFDYRTVLTRALSRTRAITEKGVNGEDTVKAIPLSDLDPITRKAYDDAQDVIDSLDVGIPVSPIDWIRAEIERAGYSVAEITGRDLSVDYSSPKNPILSSVDAKEQKDKVNTTQRFNRGDLDAIILNVAGSTGISLHASEKFKDQRQRHMIIAQPAGDINTFMQMLGRIHRTGQVKLPKYTILSVDLPTEKRPTAVLSKKMQSLNANTSSNTESATSVNSVDMLNKYGDDVVRQYLTDNVDLARAMGVEDGLTGDNAPEDYARKVTGRLALQPIAVQNAFYEDVESQYNALIDYLNKTNQNDLVPQTFDFDAKEINSDVLSSGTDPSSPFGEDAIYGEYSIKPQGIAMTPNEIRSALDESLNGEQRQDKARELISDLDKKFNPFYEKLSQAGKDAANITRDTALRFLSDNLIGTTFRAEINGDTMNAVVLNVRNTHKSNGNPYSMSKFQVTIAVNNSMRSITIPASKISKIKVADLRENLANSTEAKIGNLFKPQQDNQRDIAKIVTGNLLAAYGEMSDTRGTIINFTKADGTQEQGILLPKAFSIKNNTRGEYRIASAEDVLKFFKGSKDENISKYGISSRDGLIRVVPNESGITIQVPKSKAKGAKYFLNSDLRSTVYDENFTSSGNLMIGHTVGKEKTIKALEVIMKMHALYTLPSMAEEAKAILDKNNIKFSRSPQTKTADKYAPSQETQAKKAASIQSIADNLAKTWKNAPKIVVVSSMDDAAIPEIARQVDADMRAKGAKGNPKGFFYDGTVYVVASEHNSIKDVITTVAHETLGHAGLRGVFGNSLNKALNQIILARREEIISKAREYGLHNESITDRSTKAEVWESMSDENKQSAAEEVLASMAEKQPGTSIVKQAIAAIRQWLRNIGMHIELSNDDIIANFIIPARRYIESGSKNQLQLSDRIEPHFSRSAAQLQNSQINTQNNLVTSAKNWLANRSEDLMPAGLGLLTMRHLEDLSKARIPEFTNYVAITDRMQADRNTMMAESSKEVDAWQKWASKNRAMNDVLTNIMSDSTIYGIRPDLPYRALNLANLQLELDDLNDKISKSNSPASISAMQEKADRISNQMDFETSGKRRAKYDEMKNVWDNNLNQKARDIYDTVRKMYINRSDMMFDSLKDKIMRSQITGKSAFVAKLRTEYDQRKANGVYFPLMRFGDYWLDGKDAQGERVYLMFDTAEQLRSTERNFKAQGFTNITTGRKVDESSSSPANVGFLHDVLGKVSSALGASPEGDALRDEIYQVFLRSLPDMSVRKAFIHRKNVAGFSDDAIRGFAVRTQHMAHQIARMRVSQDLEESMQTMRDHVKANPDTKTSALFNEIQKTHQWIMNPTDSAITNKLTALGFLWYLGASPAAAAVNMTQLMTVTAPVLMAKYGVKSIKALGDAMPGAMGRGLSQAEKGMIDVLRKAGAIDDTMVHDQAGVGASGTMGYNPIFSKAMNIVGWMFQAAEVFNRKTTAIAAYRLAISNGETVDAATEYARSVIYESHFDYSNLNRSRYMRPNIAKVLLLFKQYALNVSYYLLRNAYLARKGETEQAKREAMIKLGGTMAVTMTTAGIAGLPVFAPIAAIIGLFAGGGDPDKRWDTEDELYAWIKKNYGSDIANIVIHGAMNKALGIDIASRTSMGELWIRSPSRDLEGKALADNYLEQLAGPVLGIPVAWLGGMQLMQEGHYERGLEKIVPKAARDMLTAARFHNEGALNMDSEPLVSKQDMTLLDVLAKSQGFTPTRLAEVYGENARVKNAESFLQKRRQQIINQAWLAKSTDDKEAWSKNAESVKKWNSEYPLISIKPSTLHQSFKMHEKNMKKAENGIIINKHYAPYVEQYR